MRRVHGINRIAVEVSLLSIMTVLPKSSQLLPTSQQSTTQHDTGTAWQRQDGCTLSLLYPYLFKAPAASGSEASAMRMLRS